MDKTRSEIQSLKEKLNQLTLTYIDITENVEKKEEKWKNLEDRANEILKQNPDEIVRLNVGGTLFSTRVSTLLSSKNNLFTQLLSKLPGKNEIFLDRSPELFAYILQFLRTNKLNIKRLKMQELYDDLIEEAKYFEIDDLLVNQSSKNEAKLIHFEVNSLYAGSSSSINVLEDRNLNSAILTNSPGWMILELDTAVDIEEIEIGGYTGDNAWNNANGYGCGGTLSTSNNKLNWVEVGTIPNGFGNRIMSFKVIKSYAKYIKLEKSCWLAIGYFKVLL